MKKLAFVCYTLTIILFVTSCSVVDITIQSSPPAPTIAPKRRTDLNIVASEPLVNLDPHYATTELDREVVNQIYETLFLVEEDYRLTPLLAERYEVSEDNLNYIIYLRQGVFFHDDNEFTADDVVFSIERFASRLGEPDFYLDHLVESFHSIEKIDTYTVKITTRYPDPLLISNISNFYIVHEKHAASTRLSESPCGTGAYFFPEQRVGESVVLKANDNYWQGAPSIETITWKIYPSGYTYSTTEIRRPRTLAQIAFEDGELDIITSNAQTMYEVLSMGKWESTVLTYDSTYYIIMNHEVPPFDDIRVRQALYHALSRAYIASAISLHTIIPSYSLAHPTFTHGIPDEENLYTYDIAKAKALLFEAGYPEGSSFPPILCMGDHIYESMAVALQNILKGIGMNAELEFISRESRADVVASYLDRVSQGDYAVTIYLMIPKPDILGVHTLYHTQMIDNQAKIQTRDTVSDTSYGSTFTNVTGLGNLARYSNPEVDELIDKASHIMDINARMQLYPELIKILYRDAVYIPILHPGVTLLYDKNLNVNFRTNSFSNLYREFSWKE